MKFKMWEPTECLCGFKEKAASIGMGYVGILGSIGHVGHVLSYVNTPFESFETFCNKYDNVADTYACAKGVIAAMIITGITALMTGIASALLLWGVKKKNSTLVFIYLGVKTFTLSLYGNFLLGVMIWICFTNHLVVNLILLVLGGLGVFFEIFFFLCVRVYWRKLVYPEEYINHDPYYKKPVPPPSELRKFAKMPPPPE